MSKVRAEARVPEPIFNAEQLWYDTTRWASFVDGFAHVSRLDGDWPRAGSVTWDARPGGRGRVIEDVAWFSPREGQDVLVEDERILGTQRVRFAPGRVVVELEYRLKDGAGRNAVYDLLVARRRLQASLARTLRRFAIEAQAERELLGDQ